MQENNQLHPVGMFSDTNTATPSPYNEAEAIQAAYSDPGIYARNESAYDILEQIARRQALSRTVLGKYGEYAYLEHPSYDTIDALAAVSNDPENDGSSFNKMLDEAPHLQGWLIDEFSKGSSDNAVQHIATGRSFIQRIASSAGEARMKPSKADLTPEDSQSLQNFFKLQKAIFDQSGFTEAEQQDITAAWGGQWAAAQATPAKQLRRALQEDALKYERHHLMAVGSLYRYNPRSAQLLRHKFGIRNFGHYYRAGSDYSVLTPQLSRNYTPSRDIVLSDTYDNNGFLGDPPPSKDAEAIGMENPTFMEAPLSLGALLHVRREGAPLVRRLLVRGHGTKKNIGGLRIQDLAAYPGMDRLKGTVFTEDAEIILESCNTGKHNGIARKLFKKTGITTVAPSFKTTGVRQSANGGYEFKRYRS